jgi:Domain of unknown function (DUF4129)
MPFRTSHRALRPDAGRIESATIVSVALAGVAFAAIVVMAAGGGVFRSFERADVDRGSALLHAAVGAAVGAAIAAVVRQILRRGLGEFSARTAQALTVMLVSLGGVAALTLAPRSAETASPPTPTTLFTGVLPSPTTPDGPPASPSEDDTNSSSEDVGSGVMGVVIAFGLAALIAIMLTYRGRPDERGRRFRPFGRAPELPVDDSDLDDEIAAESFAESARILLDDSDPRRAVIAAYAALLDGMAAAGASREPHEAPEEYLGRALRLLDTPVDSARELTSMFVVARFSSHPITEADRGRAVDALRAAEHHLRSRSVVA